MDLRGVSLSDLAAGSGIGLGTLNRCLAGETAFTIDALSRVARTLGTTASDLLARSRTEHP
ncbi:helix-turn-helix domain-containing protein [Salana multivorans]|uniref:helix-turn-helix domain-containing protein n=1 Tax=Salana multivorans TaxID=120377 RepID=UPI003CCC71C0